MSPEYSQPPAPEHAGPIVTPDLEKAVLDNADRLYDTQVQILRPGDTVPGIYQIDDLVIAKGQDDNGQETRTPVAVLSQPDGSREQIPIRDIIEWQSSQEVASPFGQLLAEVQQAPAEEPEPPAPEALPEANLDIHQGLDNDPTFLELIRPANQTINQLYQARRAAQAQLDQSRESREANNTDGLFNYWDEQKKIDDQYNQLIQEQRDALEALVKPIITERLALLQGDWGAAFAQPGEVEVQGRNLVSKRGTTLGTLNMGTFYDSLGPRLGQVTTPDRFYSWAGGAGGKSKTNEKTGQKASSSQHIVNLAAAMVAGNFGEETHPIEYTRDESAEYDLPHELVGKLPLYKVVRGQHRIAAIRLLEGADALISGAEIRR